MWWQRLRAGVVRAFKRKKDVRCLESDGWEPMGFIDHTAYVRVEDDDTGAYGWIHRDRYKSMSFTAGHDADPVCACGRKTLSYDGEDSTYTSEVRRDGEAGNH